VVPSEERISPADAAQRVRPDLQDPIKGTERSAEDPVGIAWLSHPEDT
jgi:hypothetical protein